MSYFDLHAKHTIIGGTVFSALPNIGSDQFLTTFIMAVFGAVVSFIASLILKKLYRIIQIRLKSKTKKETP
ncbi:hypothetical protein F6U93_04380 [Tamlana haliotis]|uniref:Uncharacterized protein n=1 Tax=Pseudotamlana haliotis TaxID=2614804 RepID=A0A6N6ML38_9FLAO|nr:MULTISPECIES: hypothetical protein [Tamlana]KAB1068997.1 hypothetical protein F6U93_04380 [Tamlana haliotis]OBQ54723.1 hypothetical protein VQ01_11290 [Tamlana sp. s12]